MWNQNSLLDAVFFFLSTETIRWKTTPARTVGQSFGRLSNFTACCCVLMWSQYLLEAGGSVLSQSKIRIQGRRSRSRSADRPPVSREQHDDGPLDSLGPESPQIPANKSGDTWHVGATIRPKWAQDLQKSKESNRQISSSLYFGKKWVFSFFFFTFLIRTERLKIEGVNEANNKTLSVSQSEHYRVSVSGCFLSLRLRELMSNLLVFRPDFFLFMSFELSEPPYSQGSRLFGVKNVSVSTKIWWSNCGKLKFMMT